MMISGIGVQQILPRTGTGWQGANPPPDQPSESEGNDGPSKPDRSTPTPGTGRIVDRVA
jgi:hypothetical protein